MKRFAMKEYGSAKEVLTEIEAAPREMDETHVRVKTMAFGVNPYDVSLRQGQMSSFRTLKFPYVLGNDGAGIVTEVGSQVDHVAVGDQVILHAVGGTYGEEIVVPGSKVAKKIPAISWAEAAGGVTPWLTAYNIVTHTLADKIGETILVQGASGAVGSLLVRLLKYRGKTVYATASKKNEELVRSLGVDEFAAYDQDDVGERFKEQIDTVIDATKGSRTAESGLMAMKAGGNYVVLNDLPEDQSKPGNYQHYAPSKEYSDLEALNAFNQLYQEADLHVTIAQKYPFTLESVIEAHEALEGHPPAGKFIVEREED
ncbi:NADP-dependent oxidoreductase [Enterococcus sp. 669A]|uniref:NADP-dependent oxidoreductase n=1 Tax=Candidatus Enterococcus moelleringii TaxID=2815325 RepID=A0ABS3L8D0_9ENTE|nr:NADP-dependent oxidoreductase [Enterococcus sp. 669A]MBO1305875.1 NADP-dependent oxidoreductase [Enterococcus sp. 669A]